MNALLIAFVAGIMGHQLERPTLALLDDPDQAHIIQYIEGGGIILGVFALFAPPRWVGALALVMMGVGAGVVAGYIWDGKTDR